MRWVEQGLIQMWGPTAKGHGQMETQARNSPDNAERKYTVSTHGQHLIAHEEA